MNLFLAREFVEVYFLLKNVTGTDFRSLNFGFSKSGSTKYQSWASDSSHSTALHRHFLGGWKYYIFDSYLSISCVVLTLAKPAVFGVLRGSFPPKAGFHFPSPESPQLRPITSFAALPLEKQFRRLWKPLVPFRLLSPKADDFFPRSNSQSADTSTGRTRLGRNSHQKPVCPSRVNWVARRPGPNETAGRFWQTAEIAPEKSEPWKRAHVPDKRISHSWIWSQENKVKEGELNCDYIKYIYIEETINLYIHTGNSF